MFVAAEVLEGKILFLVILLFMAVDMIIQTYK